MERRADANARRANRLYLTDTARPLMTELRALREEINQTALAHLKPAETDRFLAQLELIKTNVRTAYSAGCKARKPTERHNG